MRCIAIVQARSGSSRLPGKVLQAIGERSMLKMVIDRLMRASLVDTVVVATTTDPSDDPVEAEAWAAGAAVVRGDTLDVLARFYAVLERYPEADTIVRITADCPFIDPELVDQVVKCLRTKSADFAANRLPPPWKRTYPVGLDVEACTVHALRTAHAEAKQQHEREHVMPYLYQKGSRFRSVLLNLDEDLSGLRWTVDTAEDLEAVRELATLCGPEPFGWRRVLEVARENPWIGALNSGVQHKHMTATDDRWS